MFFNVWDIETCLILLMGLYLSIGFVLLIFLIRKKGKPAWGLLKGKCTYALQVHRHVGYYAVFALLLFLACFNLNSQSHEFSNQLKKEYEKLSGYKDELSGYKDSLELINESTPKTPHFGR